MTDESKLMALYGLRYNPFLPAIPSDALWRPPELQEFFFRVETLVLDGGFAMISGDNGTGKSKVLQMLAGHLSQIGDVIVGVMERPQNKLGDWYRELGDLFGVSLSPANRYGGFKALRTRWHNHIRSTLFRPVILIDEAQITPTESLTELRLLASANFDSEALISAVLCGDHSLPDRFRHKDLTPLGSRVRTRLNLGPRSAEDLRLFLDHLLDSAGAPGLMAEDLKVTVITHCAGNMRILVGMCADLLASAAARERRQLDEQLYLETFGRSIPAGHPGNSRSRKQT
jgi:general secretion pathway protein A